MHPFYKHIDKREYNTHMDTQTCIDLCKKNRPVSVKPVSVVVNNPNQGAPKILTFRENLDDVVGIEAELVGVLGVVGVQRLAVGRARPGLGGGLRSARAGEGLHLFRQPTLEPERERDRDTERERD